MNLKRTFRYHWLKFRRLQGDPRKLAWGMALGVFIGVTPTVPFHTILALTLAPLLRVSPVTAYLGIWIMNPLTIAPLYLAAYKVGKVCLHAVGKPLIMPQVYNFQAFLHLLGKGGLALQIGGLIIALPPAIISYFLTLWVMQRYRQRKARKAAGVLPVSPNDTAASRPKA
jgi:uncharacterized protein (DUF2062 family)